MSRREPPSPAHSQSAQSASSRGYPPRRSGPPPQVGPIPVPGSVSRGAEWAHNLSPQYTQGAHYAGATVVPGPVAQTNYYYANGPNHFVQQQNGQRFSGAPMQFNDLQTTATNLYPMQLNPRPRGIGVKQGSRLSGGSYSSSQPVVPSPDASPVYQAAQNSRKINARDRNHSVTIMETRPKPNQSFNSAMSAESTPVDAAKPAAQGSNEQYNNNNQLTRSNHLQNNVMNRSNSSRSNLILKAMSNSSSTVELSAGVPQTTSPKLNELKSPETITKPRSSLSKINKNQSPAKRGSQPTEPKRWAGIRNLPDHKEETPAQLARIRTLNGALRSTKPIQQRVKVLRKALDDCLDIDCKGQIVEEAKKELYKEEGKLRSFALTGLHKALGGQDLTELEKYLKECLENGISEEDCDVVKAQEQVARWKNNPDELNNKIAQKAKRELNMQLFTATKQGDLEQLKELLVKVPNWPQTRDPTGRSLIDVARSRENNLLVEFLEGVKAGCKVPPSKRMLDKRRSSLVETTNYSNFGLAKSVTAKSSREKPIDIESSPEAQTRKISIAEGSRKSIKRASESMGRKLPGHPVSEAGPLQLTARDNSSESAPRKSITTESSKPEPPVGSSQARILARRKSRASRGSVSSPSPSPTVPKRTSTITPPRSSYANFGGGADQRASVKSPISSRKQSSRNLELMTPDVQNKEFLPSPDEIIVLDTIISTNSPRTETDAVHRPPSSFDFLEVKVDLPELKPIDLRHFINLEMPNVQSVPTISPAMPEIPESNVEAAVIAESKSPPPQKLIEPKSVEVVEETSNSTNQLGCCGGNWVGSATTSGFASNETAEKELNLKIENLKIDEEEIVTPKEQKLPHPNEESEPVIQQPDADVFTELKSNLELDDAETLQQQIQPNHTENSELITESSVSNEKDAFQPAFGQFLLSSATLRENNDSRFNIDLELEGKKEIELEAKTKNIKGQRIREAVIELELNQRKPNDYGKSKLIETDKNATPTGRSAPGMLVPKNNNSALGSKVSSYTGSVPKSDQVMSWYDDDCADIPSEPEAREMSQEAKEWLSNHNEPAIEILRRNAFRCVARDDELGLSEILAVIPSDVWQDWQNKGKQNIYEFAETRQSSKALWYMGKRLEMITQTEPEHLEEGSQVWYLKGDLAQGTVREVVDADFAMVDLWGAKTNSQSKSLTKCDRRWLTKSNNN
eukprot:gene1136-672_t